MPQEIFRFYQWTRLKIKLHATDRKDIYFRERQIWWASLGLNIGFEQDGKHEKFERPILILKKFNRHVLWALPLTSRNKPGNKYYHQLEHQGKRYSVILSQLRLISSKRLLRKIRTLSRNDFNNIRESLKKLI